MAPVSAVGVSACAAPRVKALAGRAAPKASPTSLPSKPLPVNAAYDGERACQSLEPAGRKFQETSDTFRLLVATSAASRMPGVLAAGTRMPAAAPHGAATDASGTLSVWRPTQVKPAGGAR